MFVLSCKLITFRIQIKMSYSYWNADEMLLGIEQTPLTSVTLDQCDAKPTVIGYLPGRRASPPTDRHHRGT